MTDDRFMDALRETPTEARIREQRQADDRDRLATLLDEIEVWYRRFLATLSDAHFAVLAVWTAHTHVADIAYATPYLHVTAPERESGKSRTLEAAQLVACKPRMIVNVSGAGLYRELDSGLSRTMLIDEVDNFLNAGKVDSESRRDVVGMLNSGYTRNGGTVGRFDLRAGEMKYFAVYGPKILTGKGELTDTLASRSLRFPLRRRAPGETVEKFRMERVRPGGNRLRERLEEWAADERTRAALAASDPEMPEALSDRMMDATEQLVAISDLAGGVWATRLRDALVAVTGASDATESLGIRLLTAVHDVWAKRAEDHISTVDLLAALNDDDESSWGAWNDGEGMRARDLSKHLKLYGIRPGVVRIADKTPRGYTRSDFKDAFTRYIGPESATSATTEDSCGVSPDSEVQHDPPMLHFENPDSPLNQADVADVADSGPQQCSSAQLPGDEGYLEWLWPALEDGHITPDEWTQLERAHRLIKAAA